MPSKDTTTKQPQPEASARVSHNYLISRFSTHTRHQYPQETRSTDHIANDIINGRYTGYDAEDNEPKVSHNFLISNSHLIT